MRSEAARLRAREYRRERAAHYAVLNANWIKNNRDKYKYVRKNGKIDGLQVLCANCNTIKQLQYGRRKTIKDPAVLAEIEAVYGNYTSV